MEQLTIRVVGTWVPGEWDRAAALGLYRNALAGLARLGERQGFTVAAASEPVETPAELAPLLVEIEREKPDLLLVQGATYCRGALAPLLAGLGLRLGLWALPEPRATGPLPLNSFCGMNMFGSILQEYVRDAPRYKWFLGLPGQPGFDDRMAVTVRALRALQRLAGAQIGLVGGIAPGFDDFYFDERSVQARFGVKINRLLEFDDVQQTMSVTPDSEVSATVLEMRAEGTVVDASESDLAAQARLFLALRSLAQVRGLSGLALSCWPKFQDVLGLMPCSTVGRLNQVGLPVSCEGDVLGLIAMMILDAIGETPTTMVDPVAVDPEHESVQMWHCGPSAGCWAGGEGLAFVREPLTHMGTAHEFSFKPGPVTCLRLFRDGARGVLFTGRVVEGRPVYRGCAGWVGSMQAAGRPLSALDLANTIMVQGVPHHFTLGQGHMEDEVREVFAWLGIGEVQVIGYRRSLQAPA